MTESPESPDNPSSGRSLGESIRAKLEEYELDRHLDELADTVEHAVRQGVAKVGELAHDHKGDIERLLDRAAGVVDRRTEGKHAATIDQVRGSIERGVDRIAEQRPAPSPDQPPPGDVPPAAPDDGSA
jgi:hypothetical protein